jgi:XTP/dITP diphosphohydrolase
VLDVPGIDFVALGDVAPVPEPQESADTFWGNAREKALAYASATGLTAVAEDSGLEIEALGGDPGVRSARFLGPDVTYQGRFDEIYRRVGESSNRNARFVTALAVASPGRTLLFECETAIDGLLAPRPVGDKGFGYDPIFLYPPLDRTTGELTVEEKCAVSHRARAFRDFGRWLRQSQPSTL